jgi:hypothetical protein
MTPDVLSADPRNCGDCGVRCGECEVCSGGVCSPGGDLCCGVRCSGRSVCQGGVCVSTCTPRCGGNKCGDDGCGGSCGTCGTDQTCLDGRCEAVATTTPEPATTTLEPTTTTVAPGSCPGGCPPFTACEDGTCVNPCEPNPCTTCPYCFARPDGAGYCGDDYLNGESSPGNGCTSDGPCGFGSFCFNRYSGSSLVSNDCAPALETTCA